MSSVLPVFMALGVFVVLSCLLSLWYSRRLRSHAELYDPAWYEASEASKTTPLGYYSAQQHRRVARRIRKEPRG